MSYPARIRNRLIAISIAPICIAATSGFAASGTQLTLAIQGQAVPGGGTFRGFGEDADPEHAANLTVSSLNDAGQVTFYAVYTDTTNKSGIFRYSGGSLGSIAKVGQAVSGVGTISAVEFFPTLNSSGTVVFDASYTDSPDGSHTALLLSDGTTITTAAEDGHLANGGGQYAFFGNGALSDNGHVAFYAGLTNSGDHATAGIFSSQGFAFARGVQAAPGGGTFTDFDLAFPAINASGKVVLNGRITGAPDGATQGIFRWDGSLTSVARLNQAAPGGGAYNGLGSPLSINSSGQVAFSAGLAGAPDGAKAAIYRADGTSAPVALVRSNSSFPSGSAVSGFNGATMNDAGQVAFDSVDASFNTLGVFRVDSTTSLVPIFQRNSVGPDGQYFVGFDSPHINATGVVAFVAYEAGLPNASPTGTSICLGNGTNTVIAVSIGQSLAGSTITDLAAEIAENDFGQIAYTAYLADGRSGNFLFTPAIHWVSGTSGSWDTSTNWTAGLTPASIHDVFLDPPTSQTITGPAGTVTVNSLTLGGNAPVALNVGNGNLIVTSAFTIASDGSSLSVGKGSISLPVFTNHGIMNLGGTSTFAGNVGNTGNFTISGPQNWSSGSTFTNTSGSASFQTDPGSSSATPLSISVVGGTLTFNSTQHLASLSLSAGATAVLGNASGHAVPVLVTSALNFSTKAGLGLLNLTSHDMIVKGGILTNIANELKGGFNAAAHGYWNGANGIISSVSATDSRFLTTLGYRSGGIPLDGINTTSSDVLVKYTYYGDADLNGTVNGADYTQIDTGFGMHLTGWFNGDFNYDGVVNGADYSLIDNAFNQITATGASPLALIASPADWITPQNSSAVPEPGTMGLVFLSGLGMFFRRRRLN